MTKVLFLHSANQRLEMAVTWLAAKSAVAEAVTVFLPGHDVMDRFDRMLWTQGSTAFIPHCRQHDALEGETPITLVTDLTSPFHDNFLLNLADEVPEGFGRFQQVVEIVSTQEEDKRLGRERFRYYRERGYELLSHDVSKGLPG